MYIEQTTAADRFTIRFVMDDLMGRLERTHNLLHFAWENYFGNAVNHLDECDTSVLADLLCMLSDSVFDILLEYNLTVGNKQFPGVDPHMEGVARLQDAARTDAAVARFHGHLTDEVRRCMQLPDPEAAPALEALLSPLH